MSEQPRSDSTTEQVKQTAQQATDKAQEMAMSQANKGKSQAASTLTGMAGAFHQTAGQMRQQNQGTYAGYVDQAASQIENLATYLQGQNVSDMIDEVERFGREQPMLFVGGAFALGLLAARFLKASRPEPQYNYRYGQTGRGQMSGTGYRSGSFGTGYPPASPTSARFGSGYSSTTTPRTGTESGTFGVDDVSRGTTGTSRTSGTGGSTTPPSPGSTGSTNPTQVTRRDYSPTRPESRGDSNATK